MYTAGVYILENIPPPPGKGKKYQAISFGEHKYERGKCKIIRKEGERKARSESKRNNEE
jgi:hypothetical protein